MAQGVKNPPAGQEMRIQSLGQKVPLEESMATHSGIPAWRVPWTEVPGGLQFTGLEQGLKGYLEYKEKVKYKMIPFIW